MSKFLDDVSTVMSNITNNRKNVHAQLESLNLQVKNAVDTITEMDSLRALLEVATANADLMAAAEARLAANEAVIDEEMKNAVVA